MFRFTLIIAMAVLVSLPVFAQITCIAHPSDSNAIFLGSFIAVASCSDNASQSSLFDFSLESASSECQYHIEVCSWLTSAERTELVMNVETFECGSECDIIDSITTVDLIDNLAVAAIEQGIVLNFVPCSSSCGSPSEVSVLQASCVQRLGSGASTYFVPCDSTTFCQRDYSICCSHYGSPSITALTVPPTICTGSMVSGCTSTCP